MKITGGMGEFVGWEIDADDMTDLKKAMENEPDNDQKPADQGCPFDEALESEVSNG